jgi:hypothetical protein
MTEDIMTFLNRPLEGDWPCVWLDVTYVKARQQGRIVSVAVITAIGVNGEGRCDALGMTIGVSAETFWTEFLCQLTRRGLRGVKLVISDAHKGLKAAVAKVLHASWLRCRAQFTRSDAEAALLYLHSRAMEFPRLLEFFKSLDGPPPSVVERELHKIERRPSRLIEWRSGTAATGAVQAREAAAARVLFAFAEKRFGSTAQRYIDAARGLLICESAETLALLARECRAALAPNVRRGRGGPRKHARASEREAVWHWLEIFEAMTNKYPAVVGWEGTSRGRAVEFVETELGYFGIKRSRSALRGDIEAYAKRAKVIRGQSGAGRLGILGLDAHGRR